MQEEYAPTRASLTVPATDLLITEAGLAVLGLQQVPVLILGREVGAGRQAHVARDVPVCHAASNEHHM